MRRVRIERRVRWTIAGLAVALLSGMPVALVFGHTEDHRAIKGGSITWGVKDSFRCYAVGPSADPKKNPPPYPFTGCGVPPEGNISTFDEDGTDQGSGFVSNPEAPMRDWLFRFPVRSSGSFHPAEDSNGSGRAADVSSAGGVHFHKTGHLDLKLSDIKIHLEGHAGTLTAMVQKAANPGDEHSPMNGERTLGVLDLAGVPESVKGPITSFEKVAVKPYTQPGETTSEVEKVFGRPYDPLDDVTFSVDTGGLRPIVSGYADWGINKEFREGMGSPPGSTAPGGVSQNPDGSFRFPAHAAGEFDPYAPEARGAMFGGGVQFTNLQTQEKDFKLEDPEIAFAGGGGILKAKVTKLGGSPITGEVIELVNLDLSRASVSRAGEATIWRNIPTALHPTAVRVFSERGYQAGHPMDPLTVRLSSAAEGSPAPPPARTPDPSPSPSPAPSGGGGGAAGQAEATVVGGHLDWGLKKSFRDYINGAIAKGKMTPAEGATVNRDGTVRFPARPQGKVGTGARSVESAFSGAVRFTGHNGDLDLTLARPQVRIDGSRGSLVADVASKPQSTQQDPHPAPKAYPGLHFADLDLSAASPAASGPEVTWSDIPATLTEQGAQAFSGFYAKGTPLDPVRMVLQVSGDVGVAATGAGAPGQSQLASVDKTVVRPGDKLTVTSGGFQAGEQAEVWMHSSPVFVGSATSDGAGKATQTFVVPNVPPGAHRVELKAVSSDKSFFSPPFTVLAAVAPRGTLPATGARADILFPLGMAFLGIGVALVRLGAPGRRSGLANSGWRRSRALALVICPVVLLAALVGTQDSAGGQEAAPASVAPSTALSPDGLSVTDGLRTLTVSKASGLNEQGEQIRVEGRGYGDPVGYKGIYVALCVIPPTNQQPTPCLGGADRTGQTGQSHWITSNPPPNSEGLHKPYAPDGSFSVDMLLTPQISETIDCRRIRCAVVTRNDHTRTSDRSQDLFVPVTFASPPAQPPAADPSPPQVPAAPRPKPESQAAPPAPPPAPDPAAEPLVQALPAPTTTLSADGLAATDSVRTLSVSAARDLLTQGQVIEVKGSGYDPAKRLSVALCVMPGQNKAPAQCSRRGPAKVSASPGPAEVGLGAGGTFSLTLEVRPQIDEATDCREVPCVVATFNDTDRPVDRSQDIFIPVSFREDTTRGVASGALSDSAASAQGKGIPPWLYPSAGVLLLGTGAFWARRRRYRY